MSRLDCIVTCIKCVRLEGLVISGSKDRTIRIWSLLKGKGVKILKLPSRPSKGEKYYLLAINHQLKVKLVLK